jgi:hypothetical protein
MDNKTYFNEILTKYDFIETLYITDNEGTPLIDVCQPNKLKEEEKLDEKAKNTMKATLAFICNSSLDQITKIEKWKTKYITSIFDSLTVFQTKINKSLIIHCICETKNFNYNILKEISLEIQNRFIAIEKELENMTESNN